MASGVTITRTISNSTRDGNTPRSRRPRPNSTASYGYPNSSSTPASNARCAVLDDTPEVPGRSTNWRAPRPASVAEHCRRRPGRPGVRQRDGRSWARTRRRDRRSCRLGRRYSVRARFPTSLGRAFTRWPSRRAGRTGDLAAGSLPGQVANGLSMPTRSRLLYWRAPR
jgi:hypothetical protein